MTELDGESEYTTAVGLSTTMKMDEYPDKGERKDENDHSIIAADGKRRAPVHQMAGG